MRAFIPNLRRGQFWLKPVYPELYRQHLWLLVVASGAVNALIRPVRNTLSEQSLTTALSQSLGINLIVWLGLFICIDLLCRSPRQIATRADHIAVVVTLCWMLIPASTLCWLGLVGFCCFALMRSATGSTERAAFSILLLLTLREPLSQLLLLLLASPLLQFDAWAAATLGNAFGGSYQHQGNLVIGSGGFQLAVMTGCTSYNNLSFALLGWYSIVRSQVSRWSRRLTLMGLLLLGTLLLFNILRLLLMTRSPGSYDYIHQGYGASLFDALQVFITLLLALRSYSNEKPRNPADRIAVPLCAAGRHQHSD